MCAASGVQAAESADTISLHEVEVVTNRATVKTPVAFTNVSRAQIAMQNDGRDMPYLLSMVPSVIMSSDAGAGVGYSYMRVRGTDETRINITLNGVPLNDAESGRLYWVDLPDLASSVRDIQVQRGAGTSTNGSGAFGATVNMLSDAPAIDPYGQVSVSYGSYNTHKETVRAGSGLINDRWSLDARISNIGSDGYIDRASTKMWSYQAQAGYFHGGTNVRLLAFGGKEETYMAWDYASKEEMEKYGRRYNPCGMYTDSEGNTAYYPDQKDYFTQHNLQLHLGQQLGQYWRLNAAAHYTSGVGYYRQYKTGRTLTEYGLQSFYTPDGEKVKKSDLIRLKYSNSDFWGGTVSTTYTYGRVDASLGVAANTYGGHHFGQVEWVRNYIGPIDPLQKYYNNWSRKTDINTYLRANVALVSGLTAFADLQYRHVYYRIHGQGDNYDWNTEGMQQMDYLNRYNFFNPKVGLNYTDGAHRAYLSWNVAHKEPTRNCFTDGDPNHTPKAERLFDYEAGYHFTHSLFTLGAGLYYMDYKDQLVLTGQLSDTGNPLSMNVARSYRMGVELQGSLKPCKWFGWEINSTLSRNRIKDFTEIVYEDEWQNPWPQETANTTISFSPSVTLNNAFNFTVAGFEASLRSHYVSRQYLTNANTRSESIDPYFVSNLFLSYDFGRVAGLKALRLGVSINNIFNEKYCSNGYAGAGYTVVDGRKEIYRYAGFAAQATTNAMGTITVEF